MEHAISDASDADGKDIVRIRLLLQDAETSAAEAKDAAKDYYKILGASYAVHGHALCPAADHRGDRTDTGLHANGDPRGVPARVAQAPSRQGTVDDTHVCAEEAN